MIDNWPLQVDDYIITPLRMALRVSTHVALFCSRHTLRFPRQSASPVAQANADHRWQTSGRGRGRGSLPLPLPTSHVSKITLKFFSPASQPYEDIATSFLADMSKVDTDEELTFQGFCKDLSEIADAQMNDWNIVK